MPRVLITGASGFLGRHVLDAIAGGLEVHAISSQPHASTSVNVVWHQIDLLDGANTSRLVADIRPTSLLHLAWNVPPGGWATSTGHLEWVRASLALFEAFRTAGGRRAVMVGTCAEYDWRYGYCSEAVTPLRPASLYGTAKLALGSLIQAAGENGDVSTAWARVFFTFGPHEAPNRLVASVVRSLLHGEPALCSSGEHLRDFLFAGDVGRALVALLASDVRGAVNIGSGTPTAVRDVALRIGDLLGRRELVKIGARPGPPEAPLVLADVTRLRDEVGWSPTRTLDQALTETIEWWRTQPAPVSRA